MLNCLRYIAILLVPDATLSGKVARDPQFVENRRRAFEHAEDHAFRALPNTGRGAITGASCLASRSRPRPSRPCRPSWPCHTWRRACCPSRDLPWPLSGRWRVVQVSEAVGRRERALWATARTGGDRGRVATRTAQRPRGDRPRLHTRGAATRFARAAGLVDPSRDFPSRYSSSCLATVLSLWWSRFPLTRCWVSEGVRSAGWQAGASVPDVRAGRRGAPAELRLGGARTRHEFGWAPSRGSSLRGIFPCGPLVSLLPSVALVAAPGLRGSCSVPPASYGCADGGESRGWPGGRAGNGVQCERLWRHARRTTLDPRSRSGLVRSSMPRIPAWG